MVKFLVSKGLQEVVLRELERCDEYTKMLVAPAPGSIVLWIPIISCATRGSSGQSVMWLREWKGIKLSPWYEKIHARYTSLRMVFEVKYVEQPVLRLWHSRWERKT